MRRAILAACVAVAVLAAGPAHSRKVEGIVFPDYVEVADWQMPLRLSGAARVAHNYLPIYVVALYVGRARVDAGMLGRGLVPFRFVVHWQASATGDHVSPPSALTAVLRTFAPANDRLFSRTEPSLSSTICTSLI